MSLSAQQFKHDAIRLTHDLRHRSLIQTALKKYEAARDAKKSRYKDWRAARQTAAEIKWDAINHLDHGLLFAIYKLTPSSILVCAIILFICHNSPRKHLGVHGHFGRVRTSKAAHQVSPGSASGGPPF